MLLNLNDPNSIVSWWKVLPERHGPQLRAFAHMRPQFAAAIKSAQRLIKADPALRPMYERSLMVERAQHHMMSVEWLEQESPESRLAA